MLLSIIALVFGFSGLIWAADTLSDNGARLGVIFKISPMVIGMVVFGFGTSAPEILVSSIAALNNNNAIGIGNAIGSNIFNIALVLAISSIISEVTFSKKILKREYTFLLVLTIILGFLLSDNYLGYVDGIILMLIFVAFLYLMFKSAKDKAIVNKSTKKQNIKKVGLLLIVGLVVLLVSAKLVVFGSSNIAKLLGVDDLIIGLTIVSLGTSLPELSLAVASTIKKQHQMLIGNILGSNIFNSTVVLAMVALINPAKIDKHIFIRDYLFVLICTLLIFALSYKNNKINRFGGLSLLLVLGYYLYNLI